MSDLFIALSAIAVFAVGLTAFILIGLKMLGPNDDNR